MLSLVNLNFGRDSTHVEMSGWLPFSNGGEVQSSVTVTSTVDWGSLMRSKKREEETSLCDPGCWTAVLTLGLRNSDRVMKKRGFTGNNWQPSWLALARLGGHMVSVSVQFSPLNQPKNLVAPVGRSQHLAGGRGYLSEHFLMSQGRQSDVRRRWWWWWTFFLQMPVPLVVRWTVSNKLFFHHP